jgi:hypothetical protein
MNSQSLVDSAQTGISPEERSLIEAWLRGQGAEAIEERLTIPRRAVTHAARASDGQEQIWFHSKLAGERHIYNEAVTVHYRGTLNVEALRKSVSAFIQRHEAWRTTFSLQDGVLMQNIQPRFNLAIPFNDVSSLSGKQRERRANELAQKDALLPFDLISGPLLRCRLVRLNAELYRLYICLHHIIFDGVTLYNVFLPELAALYRAYAAGAEPDLPFPKIQFGDYAEWHNRRIESGVLESQVEYWKRALAEMKDPELPSDRPRNKRQSFRGSMERFLVPKETADGLHEIAQASNATLFMVLTAVLAAQVGFWTDADDIPIGTASSVRKWSETEHTVGFFLNTLVLRIDGSDDPSFRQFVARVRETVLEAIEEDELPFTRVVQALRPKPDASRHPLFQIMFSLEPPLPPLEPGWEFTQMDVESGVTKFDLHLEMDERSDGILARFIYNVDLFDRRTVQRMTKEWLRIAARAAAQPNARLSELVPGRAGGLRQRIRNLFHASHYRRPFASDGRPL